ncbi:thiamine-phosphate kinase [Flexivirga sp. ID2601S]|uniref:Thiamine-monophosphate kinase n=1 Tax=Flexivirga aerilata TaxID=1656889 RepID=A0A849AJW4_9MICO|nr:thiamine-phosphate kinase [Flexivirga aerilata]NNG40313.1 thiamine-phosphate kinase [Flexivirga aerilata]
MTGDCAPRTLADLDEDGLLAQTLPRFATSDDVLVGPGDDAALLQVRTGAVIATTDTMVLGRDWLDEWSTGSDVGHKIVVQNVADIAAMGGRCTGLLVTLIADPATPLQWVLDFNAGVDEAATAAKTVVLGGDLSSAPPGVRAVSVTALGELDGVSPVLRSGAQVGDVIAVCGTLGHAAAGLLLLQRDSGDAPEAGPVASDLVLAQRRPRAPYKQGPVAARAGATSMLDVSDGLVRDAGRIARASGVRLDLDVDALAPDIEMLAPAVGPDAARECVLAGGEEHALLATFPPEGVPAGWRTIGSVLPGDGVTLGKVPQTGGGWDHFGARFR